MPDVSEYFRNVLKVARDLDPESSALDTAERAINPKWQNDHLRNSRKPIWIHSLEENAGQKMFVIGPYYASIRLVDRTHRLATKEEIDAHTATEDKKRTTAITAAENLVGRPVVVSLSREAVEQLRSAKRTA